MLEKANVEQNKGQELDMEFIKQLICDKVIIEEELETKAISEINLILKEKNS